MTRWLWSAAACALFAGTVLATLPASSLLAWGRPGGAALALEDVRGTWWHGRVAQVRWRGRELGALTWTLRPAALLRGRLAFDLRLSGAGTATVRLLRGPRRTELRDLRATLPAYWFRGRVGGLQPQGQVRITIPRAVFADGRMTALAGELAWQEAALRGATALALGELHASFALADDRRLHGRVRDQGGPLSVSGDFVIDGPRHRVRLLLGARSAAAVPLLRMLGDPLPDGRRVLVLRSGGPDRVAPGRHAAGTGAGGDERRGAGGSRGQDAGNRLAGRGGVPSARGRGD